MVSPVPARLSRINAVIFDLDGTLVRSAIDFMKLKRETIQLLGELGVETKGLSEKMKTYEIMTQVREQAGRSEWRLPYAIISEKVAQIWNRIELESIDKTTLVPGADSVLRQLKDQCKSIGVVTRGCHTYAASALAKTGLLSFVDVIVGRDDTANPKPDPEPLIHAMAVLHSKESEVLMVGDSAEDAECAQLAGIPFVGVLSGISDQATLVRSGAVRVLDSIPRLLDALDRDL